MRSFVLVLCLALVAVACGDDDAATTTAASSSTTTSTSTSTTTSTTTTTTTMPAPDTVASVCVIGLAAGESVEVRAGVGDAFGVLGELPHDATGVGVTGVTATNDADEEWTEIVFDGQAAWVPSQFVTAGECDEGVAALWAVIDIECDSFVNVRNGHGTGYDILGTLDPDAVDVTGTGITALDALDRTWVQIEWEGGTAWVAGWFLTDEPGVFTDCSFPFPWLIEANTFGPLELGDPASAIDDVPGVEFTLQNSAVNCEWYGNADNSIGIEISDGVISEMWAMSAAVAITPEGIQVGDSFADAGAAYFGRAIILPDPFVGNNLVIDGVSYADNWTYIFRNGPADFIGTIRISPDGGFIEGGCT